MRSPIKALLAAATVAAAVVAVPTAAFATQPDPNHKVTICHRTHSASNPYVIITVDEAAINSDGGSDHQSHNEGNAPNATMIPGATETTGGAVGSIADAMALKDAGLWWSDVIPPFYENGDPGDWNSLNWDATGQAIFENGCGAGEYPPVNPTAVVSGTGDAGAPGFGQSGSPVLPYSAAVAALVLALAGARFAVRRARVQG
jgi:hypothetical protein